MIVVRIGQLAEQLGTHRNTIRNWIKSGKLPARLMGGKRYLVSEADFRKICLKFGIDPSTLKVKHLPGSPLKKKDVAAPDEALKNVGLRSGRLMLNSLWGDVCLTCGSCASICPISGVDGLDPRKAIRMAVLGLERDLIASQWPWKCTFCGKCEEVCPMNMEIVAMLRRVRSLRDRSAVPAPLQEGLQAELATGNNLGISKTGFSTAVGALSDEMSRGECPGFVAPVDAVGAEVLASVSSRCLFADPAQVKAWWKIFHVAGESWTIPSENWDGVNWGYYTCDDEAMKTIVCRMVDNMYRLKCRTLLLPECGHAYFAARFGLNRWFRNDIKNFQIVSVFDLLMRYFREGRLEVDPGRHVKPTTYHDPCHYGRRSVKTFGQGYFEEGRAITRMCAGNYVEMVRGGEECACCGAGGGAWEMPFVEERIFHGRFKARQIAASGAGLVIAPCQDCRAQILKGLSKEYHLDIEVKSLGELVADSLVIHTGRAIRD